MIWLYIGVETRLSIDQCIENLGLCAALTRITTVNRVSISILSVAFHLCTNEHDPTLFSCADRFVCAKIWSIICSVMYSLKKSLVVLILHRGRSILSSLRDLIFLGLNGSHGYTPFHYQRGIIGWLCLGATCFWKHGDDSGLTVSNLCPAAGCLSPPRSC